MQRRVLWGRTWDKDDGDDKADEACDGADNKLVLVRNLVQHHSGHNGTNLACKQCW